MRSHRSSSSGAGGLWLVRMALQPISFRISNLPLQRARVDGRAERAEVVVVANAVERHALAVEQKAVVAVNLIVRMPKGVSYGVHDLAVLLERGDGDVAVADASRLHSFGFVDWMSRLVRRRSLPAATVTARPVGAPRRCPAFLPLGVERDRFRLAPSHCASASSRLSTVTLMFTVAAAVGRPPAW